MEELAIDAVIRRAWYSKPGLLAKYDSALAVMSRALALYRCVNRHVVNDGHVEAIRALVALGADTDAQTEDGETPLQVSLRFNQHGAAQVLRALQPPIRMKKKAVPKNELPLKQCERMVCLRVGRGVLIICFAVPTSCRSASTAARTPLCSSTCCAWRRHKGRTAAWENARPSTSEKKAMC